MSRRKKAEPVYSDDTLLAWFLRPKSQEMRVFHCKLQGSTFFKLQNWDTKGPSPRPIVTAGITIRTYELERVLAALAYKPVVAAAQDASLTTVTDDNSPSAESNNE